MNSRFTIFLILVISIIVLAFTSCAHSENVAKCVEGQTYGFWHGLLHGIIAPIGFVGMLVNDEVTMYAQNNNGAWYAFGFLLGSGGWGLLAGSRKSK